MSSRFTGSLLRLRRPQQKGLALLVIVAILAALFVMGWTLFLFMNLERRAGLNLTNNERARNKALSECERAMQVIARANRKYYTRSPAGGQLVWIYNPATGNEYALSPPLLWQEAEDLAVVNGGHLVAINSAAENDWIYENVLPADVQGAMWIGLTDRVTEGTWVWTSGDPVTYTNWFPGEPNNLGDEDYGIFYGREYEGLPPERRWNDAHGDVYRRRGILERPATISAETGTVHIVDLDATWTPVST